MTRPTFKRQIFAPPPFTVAFITDPHLEWNPRPEHLVTAFEAIEAHVPRPVVTIVGGDCNGDQLIPWMAANGFDVPALVVPGNWDANQTPNDLGPIDSDPFSNFRVAYSQLFGPNDFYCYDIEGRLRIIVCQNNSPHYFEGRDTYGNCNPQTPVDYSGWTDPDSDQRIWLNARVAEWDGDLIIATHRPGWGPHVHDTRPLHPCTDAWRIPIQASAGKTCVLAGGDVHVGYHCRVNDFGCSFDVICGCGGYFNRAVVEGVQPYEWASGFVTNNHKVHVHFLTYRAASVDLETIEISDDDPVGSLIYESPIYPVTGGAD